MCKDIVERCRTHNYRWIGDIKSNRIVFYQNERFNLCELAEVPECLPTIVGVLDEIYWYFVILRPLHSFPKSLCLNYTAGNTYCMLQ